MRTAQFLLVRNAVSTDVPVIDLLNRLQVLALIESR